MSNFFFKCQNAKCTMVVFLIVMTILSKLVTIRVKSFVGWSPLMLHFNNEKYHCIDDWRCKVNWYENICSFVSSSYLPELCPLNKKIKIKCCCGSFLGFPSLKEPNVWNEF